MCSNHRLTVWEIAEECKIRNASAVSKFVPQLLTHDQRDSHVAICQELFDNASMDENFLKRIITGHETWVYGSNVETKMQSSQ
jgi:hypothetical protein